MSDLGENPTLRDAIIDATMSIMLECEGRRWGKSGYDMTLDHIYDCAEVAFEAARELVVPSPQLVAAENVFTLECAVNGCYATADCPIENDRMDIRPLTGWSGPPMVCPDHANVNLRAVSSLTPNETDQ